MPPSRRLVSGLAVATLLAAPALASGQGAGSDEYSDPLSPRMTVLRSASAVGGTARFTLSVRLASSARVRVTVTRAGRSVGTLYFQAGRGTSRRAVGRVGGHAVRRGTYRVSVRASGDGRSRVVSVRVR